MFYIIYAKHGTKPVLTRAEAVVKTNRGGWVDADWAGDIDTRRSHTGTGYILILNGGSISWKSLRPNNVSLSTSSPRLSFDLITSSLFRPHQLDSSQPARQPKR